MALDLAVRLDRRPGRDGPILAQPVPTMTGPAYCLLCGRPGIQTEPGLDPLHPRVLCRWVLHSGPKAETRGHGWTQGTLSPDEAADVALRYRAIRARKAHERGAHKRRPVRGCDRCQGIIDHRGHVRAGAMVERCPLCQLAQERTQPVRHAH